MLLLVHDLDVRVITEEGELLRYLTIDATKDYQPQGEPRIFVSRQPSGRAGTSRDTTRAEGAGFEPAGLTPRGFQAADFRLGQYRLVLLHSL